LRHQARSPVQRDASVQIVEEMTRMKFRTALVAATAALLPAAISAPAAAQVVNGFYVGGGLGYNILQDSDITPNAALGGGRFSTDADGGFVGVLSLGYGFGNGIRLEIEGNYRLNTGSGDITQYGAMVNALYDIDFGWGIVPYLGVGAGYAWADIDGARRTAGGVTTTIDDTQGGFAFQGIVGVGLPLGFVPGLSVTAEYRFFAITGLDDFGGRTSTGVSGKAGVDDLYNHSFLLGLRYAFGVAPAPVAAPVAAAPAAARTYLVFFDFNRADLTDRARAVISEAATAAPQVGTTRIEVSGHTDTVGPAGYNQALSMRRAEAVAGELERRGIPRSQMVLQAFGFTRLLVPTGPNVREPQNRRVEIVLR
jgi:outer membrane protein OmpA-like peptidoglycan-associated protein